MPKATTGTELHAEDEQVDPGKLLGGRAPADVPFGGVPERPETVGARETPIYTLPVDGK